jgi:hypothetical protein
LIVPAVMVLLGMLLTGMAMLSQFVGLNVVVPVVGGPL